MYWVTDNLLDDWIQLPECKPEHICFARLIKHVMSGVLNASIQSNPPFPGKERHFLRAQIARIFAATQISPVGFYKIEEDGRMLQDLDKEGTPSVEELKSLEQWSNTYAQILNSGRTTHVAPSSITDEAAREEYVNAKNEAEPVLERFRILQEQAPMAGMTDPAWQLKVVGDTQKYTQGEGNEVCYAVNVLKSLRWPGAVTVAKNGKFFNIYVGNGIKKGDASMSPTEPPVV